MREKILIVDDMEINRAVLVQILCGEYDLLEAENGREALEILEKQRDELSLVLLDLMMPEVNGFEVLKVMNEKNWMEDLPVLVITGEDAAGTEQQCFDAGVADFIRKPFNNVRVMLRVHNVIKLFQYQKELENLTANQFSDDALDEELMDDMVYIENMDDLFADALEGGSEDALKNELKEDGEN